MSSYHTFIHSPESYEKPSQLCEAFGITSRLRLKTGAVPTISAKPSKPAPQRERMSSFIHRKRVGTDMQTQHWFIKFNKNVLATACTGSLVCINANHGLGLYFGWNLVEKWMLVDWAEDEVHRNYILLQKHKIITDKKQRSFCVWAKPIKDVTLTYCLPLAEPIPRLNHETVHKNNFTCHNYKYKSDLKSWNIYNTCYCCTVLITIYEGAAEKEASSSSVDGPLKVTGIVSILNSDNVIINGPWQIKCNLLQFILSGNAFSTSWHHHNGKLNTVCYDLKLIYNLSMSSQYFVLHRDNLDFVIAAFNTSEAIQGRRSGSTMAQGMSCDLRQEANTWTNVDISWTRSSGIHLRVMLQGIPQPSVTEIILEIIYTKFRSNHSGDNELTQSCEVTLYVDKDLSQH